MSEHRIPQIYDVAIDEYRDVTQAEVEALVKIGQRYGDLRVKLYRAKNALKDVLGHLDDFLPD